MLKKIACLSIADLKAEYLGKRIYIYIYVREAKRGSEKKI